MSSSSRLDNPEVPDQVQQKLTELESKCEKYLYRLIELIKKDKNIQSSEYFIVVEALEHERTPAGNLAGLMDLQWNGTSWSLGKTSFVDKLNEAYPSLKDTITHELNLLHKQKFLEDDLRTMMQGILASQETLASSAYVEQFRIIFDIKKLLKECKACNDNEIRSSLIEKLQIVGKSNEALLEKLTLPVEEGIYFFAKPKQKTIISDINETFGHLLEPKNYKA